MSSTVYKLQQKNLIRPPNFLVDNTMYETIMGSVAYGVSDDTSDMDIYGWCIPPKNIVFPHLNGEIIGFGRQHQRFDQYNRHHIVDKDAMKGQGRQYDITIYSVIKYFQLCMDNNPNMIDSLFTPRECILHITQIGEMVRENRHMFLHKGCWHKLKGYAYSQLHKMSGKNPTGKRKDIREQYGFDVKFAYHVVRLLDEAEQILRHGDLNLRNNKEHLKAIRKGEVSEEDIRKWSADKEKQLEKLYNSNECNIPYGPNEDKIKSLLLNCLEHHYGDLSNAVVMPDRFKTAITKIQQIINEVT